MEKFADRIRECYRDPLDPIARQFMFRLPPTVGELKRPPLILLLGNHSSGKSTFVNHLLGARVQKTGVAPTDDGFTIITHGEVEAERDGPSVVSNPDLPYEGLRHFGEQLVSHVRLKLRPVDLLRTVTLIDSPGMIDEAKAENGRGYDFPGVVRWFAERADLVMMFFDPDKPGTTGETLKVFQESLHGIDHKLLIVLNKMDQFQNLHDFARAYGALCWNLGKVIPRKDLPMIFNTFVPIEGKPRSTLPMADFETARADLIREIRRAPTRRMDNLITQMQAFAERLRLHAFVLDAAAERFRRLRGRLRAIEFLLFAGLAAGAVAVGLIVALPVLAVVALATVGFTEFFTLPRAKARLTAGLEGIFEKLHDRELLVRDRTEDLRAMWAEVHPHAREVASKRGLQSFPRIKTGDRDVLNELITEDIPRLRSELYGALRDADAAPADAGPPPRTGDADGTADGGSDEAPDGGSDGAEEPRPLRAGGLGPV